MLCRVFIARVLPGDCLRPDLDQDGPRPGIARVVAPGAGYLVFSDSAPPSRSADGLALWLGFGTEYSESDASAVKERLFSRSC